MRVCAKIAAIMEIAKLRIDPGSAHSGVNAILDLLKSRRVIHVIDVRQVGDELLADRLRTDVGGLEMQLRHVRPNGIARVGSAEQANPA